MGGVELTDRGLVVDREPNRLDELAIGFSRVLSRLDVDHVFVAGYVAILAGRSRSTEDVDVFIERCSSERIDELVVELERDGYWGPAMPLSETYGNLANGTNIWVAPDGEMTPHLEVKFPGDEFDHASLENAIDAHVGDETIPIGPLELQIAYKLSLGGRTDLEDAAHLYTVFGETLSTPRLEGWVERLDVEDRYDRLTNA
ncbi:hypothetical protein SAMN04488066_103146 [Halorubrum aquaticum]|uniref:Nucleotidyl transferase AbiEii toxin, Type IV TA system n=1 Tax=Halorubrum aquaticum TaxID=387340 RepID=A0A1I2ZUM5_9EURY|nr:hypothetical protein [Halorubrum aquaticum]SFH41494.1 hypothetical protein SAMN04488066_103146 [Halorubrum aquaticum]